jgi:hypothetical protein
MSLLEFLRSKNYISSEIDPISRLNSFREFILKESDRFQNCDNSDPDRDLDSNDYYLIVEYFNKDGWKLPNLRLARRFCYPNRVQIMAYDLKTDNLIQKILDFLGLKPKITSTLHRLTTSLIASGFISSNLFKPGDLYHLILKIPSRQIFKVDRSTLKSTDTSRTTLTYEIVKIHYENLSRYLQSSWWSNIKIFDLNKESLDQYDNLYSFTSYADGKESRSNLFSDLYFYLMGSEKEDWIWHPERCDDI